MSSVRNLVGGTALLWLIACPVFAQDAKMAFEKLIADTSSLGTITGEFLLTSTVDSEYLANIDQQQNRASEKTGIKVVAQPAETTLLCRWSWSGREEMLETLKGSNIFENFLLTPKGLLQGNSETNYNLLQPNRPGSSPGVFYPRLGIPFSLSDFQLRDDVPSDAKSLHLMAGEFELDLQLNSAGRLTQVDLSRGQLWLYCIQIQGYVESPHDDRFFPKLAVMENPVSRSTIQVNSIQFLIDKREERAAMDFRLPPNTKVYDQILNTLKEYPDGTTAQAVMPPKS